LSNIAFIVSWPCTLPPPLLLSFPFSLWVSLEFYFLSQTYFFEEEARPCSSYMNISFFPSSLTWWTLLSIFVLQNTLLLDCSGQLSLAVVVQAFLEAWLYYCCYYQELSRFRVLGSSCSSYLVWIGKLLFPLKRMSLLDIKVYW